MTSWSSSGGLANPSSSVGIAWSPAAANTETTVAANTFITPFSGHCDFAIGGYEMRSRLKVKKNETDIRSAASA